MSLSFICEHHYTNGNSPLFNAEGKISGMLCTILDATDREKYLDIILRNGQSLTRIIDDMDS